MSASEPIDGPPAERRPGAVAWALFDWATSPFAAVVTTFVFPAYFVRAVIGDEVQGTALWGWTMGIAGLVLAVVAPVLGAVVRPGPSRRLWLWLLVLVASACTIGLWSVLPDPASATRALWLVGVAVVAVELAFVIVNAMLPEIAPPARLGYWSGLAWGFGYVAGIVVLAALLYGLILPTPAPFGLDAAAGEPVRLSGPIVGLWLLLFNLPLLTSAIVGRAGAPTLGTRPVSILSRLGAAWATLRADRVIRRFLIARAIYNEGLNTLFAFGGLFAAGTFGLAIEDVLLFGILLNVTAGIGALAAGLLEDRIGSKRTLLLAILGLLVFGTIAVTASEVGLFWLAGCGLGLFVGPAQSASRTFLARLAPPGQLSELYGVMATTGRITGFVGPLLVSTATLLFADQRAGMATILGLWLLGLALLWSVPRRDRPASTTPDRSA